MGYRNWGLTAGQRISGRYSCSAREPSCNDGPDDDTECEDGVSGYQADVKKCLDEAQRW